MSTWVKTMVCRFSKPVGFVVAVAVIGSFGLVPSAIADVTASVTLTSSCQSTGCTYTADGDHHVHVGPGEGKLNIDGALKDSCTLPTTGGMCDTLWGDTDTKDKCFEATATTDSDSGGFDSDSAKSEGCDDTDKQIL